MLWLGQVFKPLLQTGKQGGTVGRWRVVCDDKGLAVLRALWAGPWDLKTLLSPFAPWLGTREVFL